MLRFSIMMSIMILFVWSVNIHAFAENQYPGQQQETAMAHSVIRTQLRHPCEKC